MNKSICFAYYGDDKFIGWHSDTFGTLSQDSPKIYTYSKNQVGIIIENFNGKIRKLKGLQEDDFLSIVTKKILMPLNEEIGLQAATHASVQKGKFSEYKEIDLRIVECPEYNGPNPDFDKEEFERLLEERKQKMEEFGIDADMPFGEERRQLVERFNDIFGNVPCNNWIYADRAKVREWARENPKVFLEIIKPNLEV